MKIKQLKIGNIIRIITGKEKGNLEIIKNLNLKKGKSILSSRINKISYKKSLKKNRIERQHVLPFILNLSNISSILLI